MTEASKGRKIGYWVMTVMVFLGFMGGGVADIISGPDTLEMFAGLGFPAYLPRFLGVAKVLGAIAIIAPKFPRLKEWAYAGMLFDLLGAAYSHVANGDGADEIIQPLVVLVLVIGSYLLRPDDRKLADAPG